MGGAKFATKNENKSLGFNSAWEVTDRLGFALDYHDSIAESGADSPYGSNAVLGVAGFYRGNTTADFSSDFPVISVRAAARARPASTPSQMHGHRLELPQQLHEGGDRAGAARAATSTSPTTRAWTSAWR